MADAVEVLIREAVVEELNNPARSWKGQFTAEGSWLPVYEAEQLDGLRVSVVCMTLDQAQVGRLYEQRDYGVLIGFQKRIDDPHNKLAMDALTKIVADVLNWFATDHPLATLAEWSVRDAKRLDLFDLEVLYTENAWTSLIAVMVGGQYKP